MSASVTPLLHLFCQPIGASHSWHASLQTLAQSNEVERLAVLGNLAMEHRVEATELPALVNDVQALPSAASNDLHRALQEYFEKRYVQPRQSVRFLGRLEKVPDHTELLHVTSLRSFFSRMLKTNAAALQNTMKQYLGRSSVLPQAQSDWGDASERLAHIFNKLDEETFDLLMSDVHALLPANAPCWWATLVSDIGQQSDSLQNPAAIVLALGMGFYEADDYLLVYRYKAKQAGLLYRPTTLETNTYPYHFPSSPDRPRPGGLSMPLQDDLVPCSEFIHHPLSAGAAALSLQRPLRSLQAVTAPDVLLGQLPELRQQHRQRLHTHHCPGQLGKDWINRCQTYV